MIIFEETYHSLIIVELDPMSYEDSTETVEYIQQALKQAAHEGYGIALSSSTESSAKR
jgi:hypothetical protein